MSLFRLAAPLLIILTVGGCSLFKSDPPEARDASDVPVETLYSRGIDALGQENYAVAVKQFDLLEQTYPYSSFAVNAQLMQGYTEYKRSHYTDAIGVLEHQNSPAALAGLDGAHQAGCASS